MTGKASAVIVAAGSGSRMKKIIDKNKLVNKVYREINGVPVLAHTINAFEQSACIDKIVVVTRSEDISDAKKITDEYNFKKVAVICEGGECRQQSVLNGLCALDGDGIVLVHDGARCLVTPDIIERVFTAVCEFGAAAAGVCAKDSLKRVSRDGFIESTIERAGAYNVQTPQGFVLGDIVRANRAALSENIPVTDDCEAAERMGIKIKMVEGGYTNIKITTEDDLIFAKAIMEENL